jgi:NAD(P)-dependent dehydrogenase (short-subunit alcohol dehydrogenase family)
MNDANPFDVRGMNAIVTGAAMGIGFGISRVNNAGVFPSVPVLQMTPELFDRVLRINLRGLVVGSTRRSRLGAWACLTTSPRSRSSWLRMPATT